MTREQIDARVREGLDAFGVGDVSRALVCWEEAVAADPGHSEAREYLEAARESSIAGIAPTPDPGEPRPPRVAEALLRDAREMLRDDDAESAFELLQLAAQLDPESLEIESYVDLVRSRLAKAYRDRVGDTSARIRLRAQPDALQRYNLAADAGFLLSLVDGATRVDDLVTLSGMDPFDAFRILDRLLSAEIVELEP